MKFSTKLINSYYTSTQVVSGFGWVTLAGVLYGAITFLFTRLPQVIQVVLASLTTLWAYMGYGILALWLALLVALCLYHRLYPSWSAYLRSKSDTSEAKSYFVSSAGQSATVGEDGSLSVVKKTAPRVVIAHLGSKTLVAVLSGTAEERATMQTVQDTVKEYADGLLSHQHSGAMQTTPGCRYWVYSR